MKKVAILTDSTAYLPPEQVKKYNIASVPLVVIWGNETFEDGITITPDQFYSRLKTDKVMPSTSQPSAGKMQEAMAALVSQNYDVLGIFISAKLSGTIASAHQGRDLLPKGSNVEIFDSQTTIMAMGFQVLAAARAAADGASLADCVAVAEKARAHTGVYFVVDTLEFLHRGGRIGGAQRFLGTALNMKPILTLEEGKIEAQERVRTKGNALERLIQLVAEKCDGKTPIHLAAAHATAAADAQSVLDRASSLLHPEEALIGELSPTIGTHTGPGTVALAYMAGM